MKKFFYLVAMATVMMTSCSKSEEMIENNRPEDLKIKFGSTAMSIEAKTRMPIEDGGDITDLQLVRVPNYNSSSGSADWTSTTITGVVATGSVTGVTTTVKSLTVTPALYYDADPAMKSAFTAYRPAATSFTAGDGSNPAKATWTVDGKTDIIVNTKVDVSGDKNNVKNQATPTALNFELAHKLLQLRFKLVADASVDGDGAGAKGQWGDVTSIEVLGTNNSVTFTFPATVAYSGAATSNKISVYGTGSEALLPQTTLTASTETAISEVGYTMVPPPVSGDTYKLLVKTTKNTAGEEVEITLNNSPVAGDSYAITLTFKATTIIFTAQLAKWDDDVNHTGGGTVE